jgi:hypothetical protein
MTADFGVLIADFLIADCRLRLVISDLLEAGSC